MYPSGQIWTIRARWIWLRERFRSTHTRSRLAHWPKSGFLGISGQATRHSERAAWRRAIFVDPCPRWAAAPRPRASSVRRATLLDFRLVSDRFMLSANLVHQNGVWTEDIDVRLAALSGILALMMFDPVRVETAAASAKKYSCESCSADGVKSAASTALGPVTKSSGCRVRKGSANLPTQVPACAPGAFNPTVTADVLRTGRFRTGCVRNCR
jgi:hypothetical protein